MDLNDVIARGLRADQPSANTVAPGTLYFVTDESITERSNGTVWESYSGSGSSNLILVETVDVSTSEFSALDTVPKTIIPNPASNILLIPVFIWWNINITVALGFSPSLRCQYIGAPWNGFNIFTDQPFQPGVAQKSRANSNAISSVFMAGANYPIGVGFELIATTPITGTGSLRVSIGYFPVLGL